MCEFISFVVCKDGRILSGDLSSHSGIEKLHNLKPDTYREAEWVSENEDTLTVRVIDGENTNEYRATVLSRF